MSSRKAILFSIAYGSLGDLRPTVAVAGELRRLGFRIKIFALPIHRGAAQELGVDLSAEWIDAAEPELFRTRSGDPGMPSLKRFKTSVWRCCERALGSFGEFGGVVSDHHSLPHFLPTAIARGLPIITLCPMPYIPTQEFNLHTRCPRLPFLNRSIGHLGRALWAAPRLHHPIARPAFREARRVDSRLVQEGISRYYENHVGHCVNVSPHLLDRPFDWPAQVRITGYCWPKETVRAITARESEFLAQGPPPVFVTFGSAKSHPLGGRRGPRKLSALLLALRSQRKRAIIEIPRPLSGLRESGGDVLFLDGARHSNPHEDLLSRCESVICHGGAGTIHTALRAGVPVVVRPRITDQFFWAERLAAMGVSPPFRCFARSFSVSRLSHDLAVVGRSDMRQCARILGEKLRREDNGARRAAEYVADRIERHAH